MTFLQIVPGSIIASLSNYHRIYLICRIHAIHKLPMLKTIESAYLPQYPLDLTSIDQPIALPRTLESRPPLHLVDGEDLGVAMIQKELCHTTRNRPERFRVPHFSLHLRNAEFRSKSSNFAILLFFHSSKTSGLQFDISFSGPRASPHFRETGPWGKDVCSPSGSREFFSLGGKKRFSS